MRKTIIVALSLAPALGLAAMVVAGDKKESKKQLAKEAKITMKEPARSH